MAHGILVGNGLRKRVEGDPAKRAGVLSSSLHSRYYVQPFVYDADATLDPEHLFVQVQEASFHIEPPATALWRRQHQAGRPKPKGASGALSGPISVRRRELIWLSGAVPHRLTQRR
jgi:hypothetical protein